MDVHQFYSKKGNFYTVQFENQKCLTIKEIKNVFNQFGNVLYVNAAKNINGLHSVTYKNLKGALHCIKGLQDNDVIKLLPKKLEENSNNKMDNNEIQDITSKKKKSKKIIPRFEKLRQMKHFTAMDITANSDRSSNDISITDERKLDEKNIYQNKYNTIEYFKNNEYLDAGDRFLIDSTASNLNLSKFFFENEKCQSISRKSFSSPTYPDELFQKHNEIYNLNRPNVTAYRTTGSSNFIYSVTGHLTNSKIIPAENIIVANVHEDCSIHYILHLFERYEPIAVSLMRTIPQFSIRYCHVYFKTPEQALAIEKKYDKFVISGKSLIVLRNHKLIDEISEM
ncbi:hypothetical protein V1478_007235 [Vespula squamosa]|uniref:RRM domain-containing protein n=1 Tax=Vespula squamosa TaxID=30214 RepID=A0ABD2B2J9_VESSQ